MAFTITAYVILFFKNHYDTERDLVRKQNLELDASNSEKEAQNEELIQYQEEVMAQRDFIEEKNNMLEHQAIELENANEQIQAINATLEQTVEERTKKLLALNNDLDLLVYRSSHDFRRPLTTLMGLYEIARLTLKDDLSKELFNKVNSTALNMDKMLLKFFMLYNINHFRTMDVGNTLEEIIDKLNRNMISRKKDISFIHNVKLKTYKEKDVRNSLIEIILENLLENSLIYHNKPHIDIQLDIIEEGGILRIVEQDNGNGIPASFRDQVFEMYFRGSTLSTGNGLGLYVTKRAADLLSATINLDSKEDEYTRFEIAFKV
jgi:signal transduction histidine kinase